MELPDAEVFHEDLDRYAEEYYDDPVYRADLIFKQKMIDRILPLLIGPSVLEMGAGMGDWTRRIIERFDHSYIVEGSSKLSALAKDTYKEKVTCHNALFEQFNPSDKFDSIVCSFVLEHVINPIQCLRRAFSWLKPGGTLAICVPHANSLHRQLAVGMGIQAAPNELGESDIRVGHRRVYYASELESDLVSAEIENFRNISMGLKLLPGALMKDLSKSQLEAMFDLGDILDGNLRATLVYICTKDLA